jgi:prepilin-type N-terminal cleavage/methylation domain-containing protein
MDKKSTNHNDLLPSINSKPLTNSGFTLIEVLVAATLVALLSTIGVSGFQSITRSGRDAVRKTDLEQIRSALEIYKAENGSYPGVTPPNCKPEIPSDYITSFPKDPKDPIYWYCYKLVDSLHYNLCARLENSTPSAIHDTDCSESGIDACKDDSGYDYTCNYKVSNP